MVCPGVFVDREKRTDNELRTSHAYCPDHQNFPATPPIHEQNCWYSRKEVDDADHARSE